MNSRAADTDGRQTVRERREVERKRRSVCCVVYDSTSTTLGRFTFLTCLSLRVSLSPKFGLRPKISQKVKFFRLVSANC